MTFTLGPSTDLIALALGFAFWTGLGQAEGNVAGRAGEDRCRASASSTQGSPDGIATAAIVARFDL